MGLPEGSGPKHTAIARGMNAAQVSHYDDSTLAAAEIPQRLQSGDLVLLKGSRGMKLERVASAIATFRGPDLTRKWGWPS